MELSPHFKLFELCKTNVRDIDNVPNSIEVIENLKIICCRILEPVRDHYNIPFSPSSGYRSLEVNKAIGGTRFSQHLTGQAADFEIPGISNYDLAKWISINLIYDQLILENYISGIPNSGWVHCSIVKGQNRMQCLTINGKNKKEEGLWE